MHSKLVLMPPPLEPGRPHADPTCTCNACVTYAMMFQSGGCPGGGFTERRAAAANNSANN